MKIIEQYEENGYIITKFENGAIIKNIISEGTIEEPEEIKQEYISKQEIVNAQILNQLDYLTCLQELNAMKGGNL